jgi:hypothetical protein
VSSNVFGQADVIPPEDRARLAQAESDSQGEATTCCYHGCDRPAVAFLGVSQDAGDPLCSEHVKEIRQYVKEKLRGIRW